MKSFFKHILIFFVFSIFLFHFIIWFFKWDQDLISISVAFTGMFAGFYLLVLYGEQEFK